MVSDEIHKIIVGNQIPVLFKFTVFLYTLYWFKKKTNVPILKNIWESKLVRT